MVILTLVVVTFRKSFMRTYKVSEEYGVCGPASEVMIETTTLYSCSAIIMLNAQTDVLGLYHYPALCLKAAGVQQAIIGMINEIVPTEIVLWTANPTNDGCTKDPRPAKSILLDNAKVKTFLDLKKSSTCTLSVVSGKTFTGVKCVDKTLVFKAGSSFDVNVPSSETIQGGHNTTLRVKKGNIWFYFGSGDGAGDYGKKITIAIQNMSGIERD